MENHEIRDGGSERSYFTQVPNIVDDLPLSLIAFRLYFHLKRVTWGGGACYRSTGTLSKECRMSFGAICKAKQELVDAGLILIEEKKDQTKMFHSITLVDLWERNLRFYTSLSPSEGSLSPSEKPLSPSETIYITSINTKSSKAEKASALPKTPKSSKPAESQPSMQPVMFGKIAKLCQLDPKLMAARIGKAAKELLAAGYTPEDIDKFGVWWTAEDWRGKKGQAPTLEQIKTNIQRSKSQSSAPEDNTPYDWRDGEVGVETEDDRYEIHPRKR